LFEFVQVFSLSLKEEYVVAVTYLKTIWINVAGFPERMYAVECVLVCIYLADAVEKFRNFVHVVGEDFVVEISYV
jgi:hypothetical protein